MMCWIRASIIFFLCSFSTSEIIQTPRQECLNGQSCILTCQHEFFTVSYYTYWYKRFPGQGPAFLISGFKSTDLQENKFKITFSDDRKSSDLYIPNVNPGESAVYLCAQSGSGSWGKLTFGGGTQLYVTPRTERTLPSVYQLKADSADGDLPSTVCLVTDFPTPDKPLTVDGEDINLNDKSALDKSSSDVWRYSAVVWDNGNPSKDLSCKVKYDGKDVLKGEKIIDETASTCSSLTVNPERFRTNPGMNTLSLSVLGLRMLTAKAVIFNLIITLRLWSS